MNTENKLSGYPSIDKPWLKFYPSFKREELYYDKMVDLLMDIWCDEEVIVEYYSVKITAREFFDTIKQIAKSLKSVGYNKGASIPISLESVPEFLYLLFAAETIGISIKNHLGAIEEIIECIKSTNSKYYITYDYISSEYMKKIYDETQVEHIIMIPPFVSITDESKIRENIKRNVEELYSFNHSVVEDKRNIMWNDFSKYGNRYYGVVYEKTDNEIPWFSAYTSGTTGIPKEVIMSSKSVLGIVKQFIRFSSRKPGTWLVALVPPTLIAVVVAEMCYPLGDKKCLYLDPYCKKEELDKEILHYEPNCWAVCPCFFEVLINSTNIPEDYDMSYFKLLGFGAEPISKYFINRIQNFLIKHNCGAPLSAGYGQSEGGSDFTVAMGYEMILEGSSGIPLIDTIISIFEPGTTQELQYNHIGEICKKGPGLMMGYSDKRLTEGALIKHGDGDIWLHTGDFGYMTPSGMLYVLGRQGIRVDQNSVVYPLVLENKLADIPGVKDVIVVSGKDRKNKGWEAPYLFVIPEEGTNETVLFDAVQKVIDCRLEKIEKPQEVYFIKEKPISNFKTNRRSLQIKYDLLE